MRNENATMSNDRFIIFKFHASSMGQFGYFMPKRLFTRVSRPGKKGKSERNARKVCARQHSDLRGKQIKGRPRTIFTAKRS
jgi:hypothetical protein